MNVLYTDQAINSLEECIRFYVEVQGVPLIKADSLIMELFNRAEALRENPHLGQYEEYLEHLSEGHRRLVVGHIKVIYKIYNDHISITDFFDTRQDPAQMKG